MSCSWMPRDRLRINLKSFRTHYPPTLLHPLGIFPVLNEGFTLRWLIFNVSYLFLAIFLRREEIPHGHLHSKATVFCEILFTGFKCSGLLSSSYTALIGIPCKKTTSHMLLYVLDSGRFCTKFRLA